MNLYTHEKYIQISKRKVVQPDSSQLFDMDKVVCVRNKNELNQLIGRFMFECQEPFDTIVNGLSHFAGCYDKINILWVTNSDFINHSQTKSNVKYKFENGYKILYSTCDINKNEELFLNYKKSIFPQFFNQFCNKWNVQNVHQFSESTHNKHQQSKL